MAVYDQYDKQQIADEYHKSYYAISLYSPENLPELKNKLENAENSSKYLIGQMVKIPRTTLKRKYDALIVSGIIQ